MERFHHRPKTSVNDAGVTTGMRSREKVRIPGFEASPPIAG
jgi:hypothetical protein